METLDLGIDNKVKGKKGLITKTWERCRSLRGGGGGGKKQSSAHNKSWPGIPLPKSKSWPAHGRRVGSDHQGDDNNGEQYDNKLERSKSRVAPHGCFTVYVGSQKRRFVIKTKYANHPLFKMLLEEAETEYGYNCEGPLTLPCNVDLFYRILSEMEMDGEDDEDDKVCGAGCNFTKGYGTYRLLSPARMVAMEYN